jgi:hypothetical protein
MKKTIIVVFLLWGTVGILQAQEQNSGWFANQTTIRLSQKWGLFTGGNLRSNDKWVHLQLAAIRLGLSFNIKKNLSIAAGIEHLYARKAVSNIPGYFNDEVIWQHILFSHPAGAINIVHRLRLEERFLSNLSVQNNQLKKDGTNMAQRFRYLIRGVYPFNGKKGFKEGGYIALAEEAMLNFGDKSAVNGKIFDQNRIYGGVGYRFSSKFDAEIGYLRQYVITAGGNSFNNNVIQLGTFLRL